MKLSDKIYIAGHTGMVGSAITRRLLAEGYSNLVFTPYPIYDLTDQKTVVDFFSTEKPDYVFLAAAKVGGILSNNTFRAQFIYENLMIQNNIIHSSYVNKVKKLLFLGSSCIYPKNCLQPIKEEYLLTGELEYTNEPYAIAKIAGIKMCESYNFQYNTNFISVMPTNLYGKNDNYNLETSHVLPAIIRKVKIGKWIEQNDWLSIRRDLAKYPIDFIVQNSTISEILAALEKYGIHVIPLTKERIINNQTREKRFDVTINLWGTGSPYREFLHVDDVAAACIFLMRKVNFEDLYSQSSIKNAEIRNTQLNIGTGEDITIEELAKLIKSLIGFKGNITWDKSKPDGTFRKLLDVSKINSLGWKFSIGIKEGIKMILDEYSDKS
ncbi:MAG TPA: GDP-L-fucose synthase [Bacteroidales bacterium]|nr:GDP-L-fucose synthase [Bacteroidales bacterium]